MTKKMMKWEFLFHAEESAWRSSMEMYPHDELKAVFNPL
jgi:hypothetical protein